MSIASLNSRSYVCGYCGHMVGSDRGYFAQTAIEGRQGAIMICPHCAKPTFFHGDVPTPGVSAGRPVERAPEDLQNLYDEARRCASVSAYTASVLACRKLLMNIAVSAGAKEGQKFITYVEFLAENHYVPPNGRIWVDHIRTKGNEANHEVALMSQDDAIDLITFAEMLLKFMFEFPARVPTATSA